MIEALYKYLVITYIFFQETDIKKIPINIVKNKSYDYNCDPNEKGFSPDLNSIFHRTKIAINDFQNFSLMIIENIISDNPVCLLSYSLFGSLGQI